MTEVINFTIDTAVAPVHMDEILEFIYKFYLIPKPENFDNIRRTNEKFGSTLEFTALIADKSWKVNAKLISGAPIQVELEPDEGTPQEFVTSIKEDLILAVQIYHETVRQSTLYFAWVEGEDIIPEQPPTASKRLSDRLFGSNLLFIYVLFFGVNIILFLLLGLVFAVAAIIGLQLVIVLLSDKIYTARNNWRITPSNPNVHIIEYQLPVEEFKEFREKFGKEVVVQMKKEIYDKTLAVGKEPTCELGEQVFENYGFQCTPESKLVKVIDVYSIVKTAAEKFELPIPKIVISNTMVPNAAATGPSPSRGLVMITTGLLVELEEDEILSVLGHEMGHLKGRDPIVLFSIISGEFILRFTIFFPLVIINPIIYIIVVMAIIFFVAKFFETRADLVSAIKIGQPKVLAESLRKIGFSRLQMERSSSNILRWLAWDPHPPLYFRIERLDKMKTPVKVKHPLIQSAKDVFSGFRRSFGG
ncbi:M48 family metallopeptidase [Methanobacterium sp. SMA-27]|uniref:M48 family metallopeptidase n=1 Tax=Methanobacterium sp. SMA-27 TaxID=1495336 RepID=UPI00064FB5E6|nr:M48 family metallopeptidase [Methanobacterium sp. SMA-27]